jgi:RNA polymerase sigma factor (sigma-70 family)
MPTTTHLAGRALEGDDARSVRALLFVRIMDRIHRYFSRLVFSREGAEDCAQQTLLALERSLQDGTYDPSRSFNRWMWIKAHSVYVDHCRARARQRVEPLPPTPLAAPEPPAAGPVDARLDAATLLDALRARLEPEDLEIFTLFYGEELTVSDIAALVGRDRKTVRKRLDEAKRLALRALEA